MNIKKPFTSLALGLILAGSLLGASAQEATPGVLGDATAAECVTDIGTAEVPDGATGYVVDAENSNVGFAIDETLNTGDTEALASTNAIAGTLLVDADGNALSCSRVDVDLRTLVSNEIRRDDAMLNALDVNNYPVATFIVTEIQGDALVEGEETELTLIGNLSIHGVDKQVSWTATVTLQDGTITGSATTVITFDDFDVTKPKMGPVVNIDDEIEITIDLVATAQD
ncbi:MAG: YceI family protein [Thermomicrobiales bacterium]|nr:YceI family protein [Thermomicrobiales bacterium]MCO5219201.1 YceI family protein [Thermomicrobiales bacterium]MCO5228132.1 YceI family protein [Thermomicrobiales bacterium]